jgi:hypothetical protein
LNDEPNFSTPNRGLDYTPYQLRMHGLRGPDASTETILRAAA